MLNNNNNQRKIRSQTKKKSDICQKMVIATPRCLCGATVANCIIEHCEKTLKNNPNAQITLEEWRKACVSQSPYCTTMREQKESCSIVFDHDLINAHNKRKTLQNRK